jgi:hypothetical protein
MNDFKDNLNIIAKNVSEGSGFMFLRELDKYFETIKNDPLLTKALLLMHEYHQQESIELIKKSSASTSNSLASIIDEAVSENLEERYPLYSLREILRAQKEFQYIKQYEKEEDIPDLKVIIADDNDIPGLTVTHQTPTNLNRIPKRVDLLGTREHFETFNSAFEALLTEIELNDGIFSKYFSYNSITGVLYFKGIEIQINERKKLTNANHLLTFLFKNEPFEQHFYSELEESEALLENKHWSSYHKACVDIQNKVLAKTEIADFLDFNSGPRMYVRINPIYSTLSS